jgi:hypothetical protein
VNAVNVARKMADKDNGVDHIESPQWHYICCAGKNATVAHASEEWVKKQDSSHPKTFAVKCFGPIAYPIGGSRYHMPKELKSSTPTKEEESEMSVNPLNHARPGGRRKSLTGLDSIGQRGPENV